MSSVDDELDAALAGARLAATEQLVVLLLHKAGGKATVTAADVAEVQKRRPSMVRWPQTDPTQFELELVDQDGRPWRAPDNGRMET